MITRAASKRAKMDVTSTVTKSPSPDSESNSVVSAQPTSFIPFQTGPSLDDVLLEVVSYLPTHFSTFNNRPERILIHPMYVILCTTPARTPILRALSQTSRLLRSRCLPLVWQRTAFWGPNFGRLDASFDEAIGKRNYSSLHVLKACPYLLPLIRTVSVMLTTYQKAEIIPAFADCLATLPNLNTTQIIYTDFRMQTAIKNAFRGKRFPSVRRISLPSCAHEIIKRCPNLEEVICVDEDGNKIIQSIVEGKCHQVRILKGISAPLTRLVDLVPNLTHASVAMGSDMTPLTNFPFLGTIEILIDCDINVDLPLSEFAALDIGRAREILKGNKSQAEKTVVLTKSNNLWDYRAYQFDVGQMYTITEAVKV
ncbi:hypothetical protein EV363DRAFT_1337907 [Boletus edulis]|uniref:Uncharacterized protein n=1 Tax=Boletus edulis BED1 TaxID=1328754 RepID=A0AAD4GD93_BOLED|nr:hypothetical protein EV363DRAFT_1348077 [Boletus edulis]KAF8129163.1 hypothetical protein EV363DRAFT_1337907 [Boletus edulis]KAF8437487.1 hypothetical protein L210DRAFT_3545789 [Boletus edulis BED1]